MLLTLILSVITVAASAQTTEWHVPKMRIAASGGLGYLTASGQTDIRMIVNQRDIDKANNELRLAKQFHGDVQYLFDSGWGIGVKYLFQKTSTELNNVIVDIFDGYHYLVTDLWEKDYINFVGPSLYGQLPLGVDDKFRLTSLVSVGYAWWRGESFLLQNTLIKSGNVGANAEIGMDYLFHPNFGIGVNLGCLLSYFDKISISNGLNSQSTTLDKDSRFNASNIYLSAGIRYYINK